MDLRDLHEIKRKHPAPTRHCDHQYWGNCRDCQIELDFQELFKELDRVNKQLGNEIDEHNKLKVKEKKRLEAEAAWHKQRQEDIQDEKYEDDMK